MACFRCRVARRFLRCATWADAFFCGRVRGKGISRSICWELFRAGTWPVFLKVGGVGELSRTWWLLVRCVYGGGEEYAACLVCG